MDDCLFCQVANQESSKLVWQDDLVAAFNDINPKAPVHILVVPKRHLTNLDDLSDIDLAGHLLLAVKTVAHNAGLKGKYRVKVNNGKSAGQVVEHLHFHILGGKEWKE